jgi:heat shock protein HslJ
MIARHVILLLAVLSLVACVPPEGGIDEDDVAGDWLLDTGAEVQGEPLSPLAGHRITLRLGADGTLGGSGGCNSYAGTYDLVGGVYEMGAELTMTAMDCGAEVQEREDLFLQGLRLTETVELTDGGMAFTGEDTRLNFTPITPLDPADLAGRWRITAVGRPGEETPVEGEPFVRFSDDGTMTGSTGCRDLSGRFVVRGDEVLLTELAAEGECSANLADQDGAVVEVLGDGFTVDFSGGTDGARFDSRGGAYLLLGQD